jgi:hypothetical protein
MKSSQKASRRKADNMPGSNLTRARQCTGFLDKNFTMSGKNKVFNASESPSHLPDRIILLRPCEHWAVPLLIILTINQDKTYLCKAFSGRASGMVRKLQQHLVSLRG